MCVGSLHKHGTAVLCFLKMVMTLYASLIEIIVSEECGWFLGLRDDAIFFIHPLMHMIFPQDKMPKRHREKIQLYTTLIAKIHLLCG